MWRKNKNNTINARYNADYIRQIVSSPVAITLFILTLSLFGVLIPSQAHAVKAADMLPTESAQNWAAFNGLSTCIGKQNNVLTNPLNRADVNNGAWFAHLDSGGSFPKFGFFYDGAGKGLKTSQGDRVNCGGANDAIDWIPAGWDLWGLTGSDRGVDLICALGATREAGANQPCTAGGDGFLGAGGGNTLTKSKLKTVVIAQTGAYPGDTSPETDLSPAGKYFYYKSVFMQGCLTPTNQDPFTGAAPANPNADDSFYYANLKLVDQNGTMTTENYAGARNHGYKPWAFSRASDGADVKRPCGRMAEIINANAEAYKAVVGALPNGDTPPVSPPGTPGPGDAATTCAIGGIGWIVCPVVNFMASIADSAYGFLANNFLSVKVQMFDTGSSTYKAWSIMQSFANVAFVIAFLIIIFSQLTGFGIANYGIKKLLPRIIIAAILVNLSYFICQLGVDLSNILGKSMSDLFVSIAVPAGTQSTGLWSGGSWTNIAGGVLAAAVAGAAIWAALSALIPVLIAAVVGLVMVLFILVARQAIIVLLVVISPLAFVAYLLPNTENLFTKWRKLLTSMLLLYPIVALVYGVSVFASKILNGVLAPPSASLSTRLLGEIAAASVVVLPLFLIPSLLKKSMDGVGNIGKTLNNLGSRVGKAGGQKYTNSGYNQHRVAKQKDMKARTMTGNYRGRGGNWNPRNLRSKLNSRANRNRVANFATGGYAASRELAGQTQDRKDIAEAMEMFGHDDDLALAWANDGGKRGAGYAGLKTDSQRAQYDRMRTAGLDRKASSHIAAAQMISTGGKGDHGATEVTAALAHAEAAGASKTTIGGETEQAKSAFRKAGRGDALAALKTAGGVPTTAAEGWSEVAPSTVHREALKDASGIFEYQHYLSLKPDNTRAALAGYDQMEGRAQTAATSSILAAADKHAENAYLAAEAVKKGSGVRVDITTIQQAKAHFGVR